MDTAPLSDLLKLSVEERIRLAQELWDSIPEEPDLPPLGDEERRELERRLAAHELDPSSAIPHEVVRDRLRAPYGV